MMKKREVAVATSNERVYYNLVEELRNRKIDFVVRSPGESIPLSVKVVLTTRDESKLVQHHTVLVCEENDFKNVVERALSVVRGDSGSLHGKLIVGIDPGKTIGFALIERGIVTQTASYNNLQQVFQAIKQVIQKSYPKKLLIKVGTGGSSRLSTETKNFVGQVNLFMEFLSQNFKVRTTVMLVDERNTTTITKRMKVKRREKDETSAVEIALR